ncbi:MAG TPA: hypothetical protein VIF57_25950 [Polyangia bacterium]|jgi:hypothetical protein
MGENESRPEALSAEDQEYLRGQAGCAGSGALGGWSQSAFGGYFDNESAGTVLDEVRAEVRELRARTAIAAPEEPTHATGLGLAA